MNVYDYIKEITVAVVKEMTFGYDQNRFAELNQWIIGLRAVHRPQFLHANVVAEEYWKPISESETIYDFVTRGTILFQTLLDARNNVVSLQSWRQAIADSISGLYATKDPRRQIVSKLVSEKLPANDYIRGLLQTETWLVFILTLDMFMSHLPLGTPNDNAVT